MEASQENLQAHLGKASTLLRAPRRMPPPPTLTFFSFPATAEAALHREYHKALLRIPIVPILFLALWGIAVYFLRASLNADVFGTVLDTRQQAGQISGSEDAAADCGEDDASPPPPPSPRHIILSALTLLATLFWCFVVWCGLLGGSVEGAVFSFYGVIPLVLIVLPAGGCYSSGGGAGRASGAPSHYNPKDCFLCSSTFFRVLWPTGARRGSTPPFVEIFVADALTSLSKAISDCGLVAAVVLSQSALFGEAAQQGSGLETRFLLPLVLPPLLGSIPYVIRIRQVLLALRAATAAAERRNHMINLAKYAANFPGIWLQAVLTSLPPVAGQSAFGAISGQSAVPPPMGMGFVGSLVWALGFYHPHGSPSVLLADVPVDRRALERAVLFLGFASGVFSFLWDVQVDWGLSTVGSEIFATPRSTLAALSEPPADAYAPPSPKSTSSLISPTSPVPSKSSHEASMSSSGASSELSSTVYFQNRNQMCGLRRQLLFGSLSSSDPRANTTSLWMYHGAVAFNLVARLASALLNLTDIPTLAKLRGIDLNLLLQVLEVLRRSIWSVFRIEWECIKKALDLGGSAWHARHM